MENGISAQDTTFFTTTYENTKASTQMCRIRCGVSVSIAAGGQKVAIASSKPQIIATEIDK